MEFELWICLDLDKDLIKQENYFKNYLMDCGISVLGYKTDNESVLTLKIEIDSLHELLAIPAIVDDNIIIMDTDSDVIISVKDAHELGLI